jgi:PAS domain S-box-containing protein
MDDLSNMPSYDLERSIKERSTLDQISQTLTSNFDLGQLLDAIHHQLTQLMGVDNFYVALLAPQRKEIWYPLAVKNGVRQDWSPRALADRLTDRVIISGKAILLPHHARNLISQIGLPSSEEAPHAWIGVPLITSEQTIGCLALFSNSPKSEFTEADLNLLITLSGPTSIAIEVALRNALLTSDLVLRRDRLAIILNSVGEGIAFIEQDGRITLANLAIERITGYPQKDFIGKRISELPEVILNYLGLSPNQFSDDLTSLVDPDFPTQHNTIKSFSKGAQELFLERTIHLVLGQTGEASGWLLTLRDVSEEQLARKNRDLISETLIHDLRSPISAVLSAVDVVEDATEGNDPTGIVKPSLQIARRSAQRVLGMIESMLEIARFQAGKIDLHLTKCNIRDLGKQVLAEFSRQATEFEITLVNNIPDDLPMIQVDQVKIIRVLTNLVDNAITFTPIYGSVQISADLVDQQGIEIKVSDTGPGIPKEYHEKIFDRFSQIPGQVRRKRGSGLGLTYCRMAVEAHSGRIWVESQVGTGSIFHVLLPIN